MAPDLTDLKYSDIRYDGWRQAQNTVTFTGSVSGTTFDLFDVTGDVVAKVVGVCTTTLSGASAVIEVGVTGNLSGIIAQTTATDIDVNEIWHDASPDSGVEASTVMAEKIVANGLNISSTVTVADIVSGAIKFICLWKPLSTDGDVVSS